MKFQFHKGTIRTHKMGGDKLHDSSNLFNAKLVFYYKINVDI